MARNLQTSSGRFSDEMDSGRLASYKMQFLSLLPFYLTTQNTLRCPRLIRRLPQGCRQRPVIVYESIAMADIPLVLPLLKNPAAVEAVNQNGLTCVTSQMRYTMSQWSRCCYLLLFSGTNAAQAQVPATDRAEAPGQAPGHSFYTR